MLVIASLKQFPSCAVNAAKERNPAKSMRVEIRHPR
jgi:hypothetical protein